MPPSQEMLVQPERRTSPKRFGVANEARARQASILSCMYVCICIYIYIYICMCIIYIYIYMDLLGCLRLGWLEMP